MILSDVLRQFDDPSVVVAAVMQFGDLSLLARAETKAASHGESLGEYAAASIRLFSNQANGDDWVALMAAMGRADDPGAICLRFMLEWAVAREGQSASCCGSCGGE